MEAGRRRQLARHLGCCAAGVAVAACLLLLLQDTAAAIVQTWLHSVSFYHGFMIVPICLYLAWTKRNDVAAIAPAFEARGLAVVMIGAFIWLCGRVAGTPVVEEFSLVLLVQSVVLVMYGWPICRVLAFPLLYLYFAVPAGEALIPRLQSITASISVMLLKASGIPVFSDGDLISIPTGNFLIAESCSGIRYLISSLAIGVLFAGLMYRSWVRRAGFVAVSLLTPILANGIRAYGIIVIAYLTSIAFASGIDHLIYGWILFSLITLSMLAAGMWMREKAVVSAGQKFRHPNPRRTISPAGIALAGTLALLPISAAKLYGDHVGQTGTVVDRSTSIVLPQSVGAYRRVDGMQDAFAPRLASPDMETGTVYRAEDKLIHLHIGFYRRDRAGAEAVSSSHHLIGSYGGSLAGTGSTVADIDGQSASVSYLRMTAGGGGRVIWYWYLVDGQFTGNAYLAKLLQLKAKLIGGPQSSAIIVAAADYGDSVATAENALREFTAHLRLNFQREVQ